MHLVARLVLVGGFVGIVCVVFAPVRLALRLVAGVIAGLLLGRSARRRLHHRFHPVVASFLSSRFRKRLRPPSGILAGIGPGMVVLDVGAGSGAYTLDAARAVGPAGRVVALDSDPNMLRRLEARLATDEREQAHHVIAVIEGTALRLPLADKTVDRVCMVSVLQEIPGKDQALREAQRVLKEGGALIVSEMVLDPDFVTATTTTAQLARAGFHCRRPLGHWWSYTVTGVKSSCPMSGLLPDAARMPGPAALGARSA